jgi:hypothetical protein
MLLPSFSPWPSIFNQQWSSIPTFREKAKKNNIHPVPPHMKANATQTTPAIHEPQQDVAYGLQNILQKRHSCKTPPKDRLQMIKQSKFILRRHSVQWIVRQEPREDRSCLCHQSFCLCRVVTSPPYDLGEVELCSCYRCFRPEPLVCSFFCLHKSCSQVHSIRYQFRFLLNMWGKGIVLTLLRPTSSVVHTMHQQHSSSAG